MFDNKFITNVRVKQINNKDTDEDNDLLSGKYTFGKYIKNAKILKK